MAIRGVAQVNLELHAVLRRQRLKNFRDPATLEAEPGKLPFHASEEDSGLNVGVLVKVEDVAAVAEDEIRIPGLFVQSPFLGLLRLGPTLLLAPAPPSFARD